MSARTAAYTIPRPTKGVRLVKKRYSLRDIAKLCHRSFMEDNHMLRGFAQQFSPDRDGLHDLFDFVDKNFRYIEDRATDEDGNPINVQAVQSPAAMWHTTRNGDCKSFTVFIASAVHHMGLPVILRLVGYGNKFEKHIYPVAILDGEEIPMDVVFKKQQNGPFGSEKMPYDKIQDIIERPGLYKVGTTNAPNGVTVDELNAAADHINDVFSSIPASVIDADGGDITEMTKGEFQAWQLRRALAANGQTLTPEQNAYLNAVAAKSTAPAFAPVRIYIPQPEEVSGVLDKVKKVVKKVVDVVGDALKKFVNVFHKDHAKKVAPFFLYQYMTPAQLSAASPEVRRRKAAQDKILKNWEDKGKIGSKQAILTSMATEFKKEHGVTPQQVIAFQIAKKGKVKGYSIGKDDIKDMPGGNGGASTAAAAAVPEAQLIPAAIDKLSTELPKILETVKKVFSILGAIFKKKDKNDEEAEAAANAGNSSDLSLLEAAGGSGTYTQTDTKPDGTKVFVKDGTGQTYEQSPDGTVKETTPGGGSGGGMLPMLALGAAGLYLLNKK